MAGRWLAGKENIVCVLMDRCRVHSCTVARRSGAVEGKYVEVRAGGVATGSRRDNQSKPEALQPNSWVTSK